MYQQNFLSPAQKKAIVAWLGTIHPLWEFRFSTVRPLPEGETQRRLLRPVYWLGNWQFACLGYYHPPRGIHNRSVRAEPFPPVLQELVAKIERLARGKFHGKAMPRDWRLNTCLVNLYGARRMRSAESSAAHGSFDGRPGKGRTAGEKWNDVARVGEHKDFEPGPVASISLGERAMFQFVASRGRHERNDVVFQQWLDDGSLQLFGGEICKERLFHRVQRVERKGGFRFPPEVPDYETRRVNFTFRYVPEEHIVRYRDLPPEAHDDVKGYMQQLAQDSEFFRRELDARE